MPPVAEQTASSKRTGQVHYPALKVAIIYAGFSVLWILFSDQIVLYFIKDAATLTRVQMVKGWGFVVASSCILYYFLLREIIRVKHGEKALRESRENYQEVFNATSEAIIILDSKTGKILDVNRTMLELFGCSHQEALQYTFKNLRYGQPPFSEYEAQGYLRQAVEEGPQLFEWQARKKSGQTLWTEIALKRYEGGGHSKIIAVIRDISGRKQVEETKSRHEAQVRQLQKMQAIGTLAGGIAHDFNNILSAIIGYSELVRDELPPGSSLTTYVDQVLRAGNRARDLVQQILTFSRQTEKELKPIQIHPITKEALKLLRASIPTSIEIKSSIDTRCGAVLGDPTQIHQILMNLCTNAYQSMRNSGGTMGVVLSEVEIGRDSGKVDNLDLAPGRYAKLEVSDTGPGMTRAVQEKIFDPYFTTKSTGEGTGLGLSVVHGIVKSMKGHISVYSEPGMGATFNVYIPLDKTADERPEQKRYEPIAGGHERILFVDDETPIVRLGQQMLESLGYQVTAIDNSPTALQAFQAHPGNFDLVITDMSMPKMTGVELARALLAIEPDLPIILCTGFSEIINRDMAKGIGIREYIMKPIIKRDMANVVRKVLDNVPV